MSTQIEKTEEIKELLKGSVTGFLLGYFVSGQARKDLDFGLPSDTLINQLTDFVNDKWIPKLLTQQKKMILEESFNLSELKKDWEEHFYESEWTVDTLKLTKTEEKIIEELGTFLPRHMAVYDWNLPYAEETILIIRRMLSLPSLNIKEDE